MSVEKAIVARLNAVSGVTTLVSDRIGPAPASQNVTLPYITMARISTPRIHALTGPVGLANPRVQIDAYAATTAGAKDLADQIRIALDGWSGTAGGVVVQGSRLADERDFAELGAEPIRHGSKAAPFRVSLDFILWHEESTT